MQRDRQECTCHDLDDLSQCRQPLNMLNTRVFVNGNRFKITIIFPRSPHDPLYVMCPGNRHKVHTLIFIAMLFTNTANKAVQVDRFRVTFL